MSDLFYSVFFQTLTFKMAMQCEGCATAARSVLKQNGDYFS